MCHPRERKNQCSSVWAGIPEAIQPVANNHRQVSTIECLARHLHASSLCLHLKSEMCVCVCAAEVAKLSARSLLLCCRAIEPADSEILARDNLDCNHDCWPPRNPLNKSIHPPYARAWSFIRRQRHSFGWRQLNSASAWPSIAKPHWAPNNSDMSNLPP